MRLVLPDSDIDAAAEVECSPTRPLPVDLCGWQQRVVARHEAGERVEVRSTTATATVSGWPVTLVRSDLIDGDGVVIRCRLHGLYHLIDRACVVTVTGPASAAVETYRDVLLAADVDWRSDELVALAQLWETSS